MKFLSKQEAAGLKGILVCMVLLSHLSARVSLFSGSLLGTIFYACGYLAVAMFFFLSGYGLFSRYRSGEAAYMKTFFRKKILSYYGMCLCVIVLYLIRDLIVAGGTDWLVFAQSFLFGKTIVDMGWYLQAQMLLYLIFFLVFRLTRKHQLLWVLLLCCVYCAVCPATGLSETWYEGVLAFPLGMLCAKHKDKIVSMFSNWKAVVLGGTVVFGAFAVTLLLGNKPILPDPLRIPVKMVSAILFCSFAVIAVTRIPTANPVTVFLGKRSFELYVLQGLLLYGLRPVIVNDWLYMFAVAAGVVVLAIAAHPVLQAVSRAVAGKAREGE